MLPALFPSLSWLGVLLLMAAHVSISLGLSKRRASRLSAAGAMISALASAGMGIWSVCVLNLIWMGISAWGSFIPERATPLPWMDRAVVVAGALVLASWSLGPQAVSWAASGAYVAGWLGFSSGLATRRSYLLACVVAGIAVVPALLALGAHAFAANEAFGVVVSALALFSLPKADRGSEGDDPLVAS